MKDGLWLLAFICLGVLIALTVVPWLAMHGAAVLEGLAPLL